MQEREGEGGLRKRPGLARQHERPLTEGRCRAGVLMMYH